MGAAWFRTVVRRLAWSRRSSRAHERLVEDPIDERNARSTSARAAALCSAIDALPRQYREVLERRYWADEPPRVIAAKLGVDVRVVRNRLHRARMQLHDRLREREGSRGSHSMLVVIAGGVPTASMTAATAAATGASAGATKVTVAGAISLLLLGAFAAVQALSNTSLEHDESGSRVADARTLRGPADVSDLSPVADVSTRIDTPRMESGRAQSRAGTTGRAFSPSAAPGPEAVGIELEVRDRASGRTVEHFELAFRSIEHERDFSQLPSGDLSTARFAPGRYALAIRARGYDDRDLGEVELQENGVQNLGIVRIDRGAAVVEGRIVARGPLDPSRFIVTATGSGRWSCVECDSVDLGGTSESPLRCPACGFDGVDSVVAPHSATGAFAIDQLVGGPLRLVVSDAGSGQVYASRIIAVPPASTISVEISIDDKDVIVALEDAEGEPFDGAWIEDAEVFRAPIQFHLWSGDIVTARTEIDPGAAGLSLDAFIDGTAIVKNERDITGDLAAPDGGAALEELWPSALPAPPGIRPKSVDVDRLEAGRYLLRGVPVSVDSVQVGSGVFVESPVPFRGEPGAPEIAEVVVDDRCGVSSREVLTTEGVTCTTCHKAQGM